MVKGNEFDSNSIKENLLSMDQVFALFYCAKQYDVSIIYKTCLQYLKNETTIENATYIYENIRATDEGIWAKETFDFLNK